MSIKNLGGSISSGDSMKPRPAKRKRISKIDKNVKTTLCRGETVKISSYTYCANGLIEPDNYRVSAAICFPCPGETTRQNKYVSGDSGESSARAMTHAHAEAMCHVRVMGRVKAAGCAPEGIISRKSRGSFAYIDGFARGVTEASSLCVWPY